MKIVVGASSFGSSKKALKLLEDNGIELIMNPYGRKMNEEEIICHLQGADGLLAGLEPLNERVFAKCPDLKAIARIGIGMTNVDLEAAKQANIIVSNTPLGPTASVAETTLSALLSISHNLFWTNDDVHRGIWKKRIGHSISEYTILVIGYGNIGKATAKLLESMGAKIIIYDKYNPNASTVSFEEGIKQADVITIHASGEDEIISKEHIDSMKDGVIILNSARGKLINEDAIYDALNSGKVSALWCDALWQEPYEGKVRECPNAILTPHICTYTQSCRENMELQAVENILRDLGGNNNHA